MELLKRTSGKQYVRKNLAWLKLSKDCLMMQKTERAKDRGCYSNIEEKVKMMRKSILNAWTSRIFAAPHLHRLL
jgi:hypothetical protein